MNQIDHDPNEPKIDRTGNKWLFIAAWVLVVLFWLDQYRKGSFDWEQIALGFFTAFVLTIWAIEITGNKIPDSWRKKP